MRAIETRERIRVHRKGLEAIPLEFSWRGRRYAVRRIEQVRGRGAGATTFQLQTVQGLRCRITHDVRQDVWRVERILQPTGARR